MDKTKAFTWEDVTPTLIPNTTMQRRLNNGTAKYYKITPIKGYVLHIKNLDMPIENEMHEQIGTKLGYTDSYTTCLVKYDFSINIVTDENGVEHTAYGSREFFTCPVSEVLSDQR